MIVAGSPPNSGRGSRDIFSRGASVQRPAKKKKNPPAAWQGTLHRVGSFGLTHVPVARPISLHPSRCHFVPRTTPRRTCFSEAKTNVGELLEGHSHRFCLFFLSLPLSSLLFSRIESFVPSSPSFQLLFFFFFFFFFSFFHSLPPFLAPLLLPLLLLGRFDLATRARVHEMLFRHRVPTRRRGRLDTTRRRYRWYRPVFPRRAKRFC